jgi:flagellar biosynthetic protein FliR
MVTYSLTLATLEYYLVILMRVASFFYTAPFFGMQNVPRKVKIGLSMVISILLFEALPRETLEYGNVLEYAGLVVKEAVVGLVLGLVANICTNIVSFAGRIIDMEIGLSMASAFDPVTKENTTITGTIYNYLVLMLLVVSNMHQYLIRAFADAYQLIPIQYSDLHLDQVYTVFVQYMADSIIIGFRIVLPFFCATLLLNVVLGILAKVAPQMNMFAVGIQMKVLVGLAIMFATIVLLPTVSEFIFTEMKVMVVAAIEAMR